jgi:oxygen-dependent protoporphyrinogen oxidase
MRAIVVGAGIAGLVAAHRLRETARQRGEPLDLVVLEAEDRAGGHAWTLRDDDFLVEGGPNGFLARPREPQVLDLARELGLEARLIEARPSARKRFVLLGGRLERAPDSPPVLLTSRALTAAGKLRLLLEPWARRARPGVEETVYEFACRRIGREAAERLVDTAVSGISAGDSRRLSVAAAFPLMVEMEREHGSLIRAMVARRREGLSRLMSFDGGLGTMVDALRDRLGPALRTRKTVRALKRRGVAWRVECADGVGLEADHLILALPAARAAELLAPVDATLGGTLASIPYAGIAMVALAYRESDLPRPLDGYGYLVGRSERLGTLGVVWESSLFAGRAPRGVALLRAMLGGVRHPDVAALPEDALVARARLELAGAMGLNARPLRTWVRRWPRAIAQYERGHLERVARAREAAARVGGLELVGASYDGASFPSAVASGERVAARVWAAWPGVPASAGVA